jgi:hypothetical protein
MTVHSVFRQRSPQCWRLVSSPKQNSMFRRRPISFQDTPVRSCLCTSEKGSKRKKHLDKFMKWLHLVYRLHRTTRWLWNHIELSRVGRSLCHPLRLSCAAICLTAQSCRLIVLSTTGYFKGGLQTNSNRFCKYAWGIENHIWNFRIHILGVFTYVRGIMKLMHSYLK